MVQCIVQTLVVLICITLYVPLQSYEYKGYDVCNKLSNCSACISYAPYCAWCSDQEVETGRRCRTAANNQTCSDLINPGTDGDSYATVQQELDFEKKDDNGTIIQIKPQKFSASIRNGSSIKFSVSVQPARDYPLDLYFVMDHSNSMKKTLDILKESVDKMSAELKVLTNNHRIGFGTFVDKTTAPFIYTTDAKLKNPCEGDPAPCPPAYNFNNTVSLEEYENFKELIEVSGVSASVDLPEAGMDALMQVAACKDQIGWRTHSRKVIVYLTDTGFHFAGDGLLGGQVERNDGKCWLEDGRTYSKEQILDYPSIHQVVKKMVDNQMIPIFGVTEKVLNLYRELKSFFPYGSIGQLSEDSQNLVDLIVDNYKNISSEIAPRQKKSLKGVTVEHVARCPGKEGVAGGICSDVSINSSATFDFTVTAEQCLDQQEELVIEFAGFGQLKVDLSTLCTCNCSDATSEIDPEVCSGNGLFECGTCVCLPGFSGDMCECSDGTTGNVDSCKAPDSSLICSGRGQCRCGSCDGTCQGTTFGPYCECDTQDCLVGANGLVCSGNGDCECPYNGTQVQCNCYPGWSGDTCDCTDDVTDCMFNGVECDNHGTCKCGKCECDKEEDGNTLYKGKYCQLCPYCNKCEDFRECTICVAGTSDEAGKLYTECDSCDVAYSVELTTERRDDEAPTDDTKTWCIYDEECQYSVYYMAGPENQTRQRLFINNDPDCGPINIIWVIVGVVLAVVILGIFIICLWKCITMYKDKQEYKKFIEDMENTKFASTQSPLYNCPITTVNNPIARKM